MSDDIIRVEPMDSGKKNSYVIASLDEEGTVVMGDRKTECYWNGTEYPEDTLICDNGVAYECQSGRWLKQKDSC